MTSRFTGIDEELMWILREMLKGTSCDDSWFALLQEHNLTVLKVLKTFSNLRVLSYLLPGIYVSHPPLPRNTL